jgi:hypothetical protein
VIISMLLTLCIVCVCFNIYYNHVVAQCPM